ncbi:hypothetical protein [Desulfoluna spongiiphila]|uniref:Uncharacterized protein n=1 Tax=Desulfoluna spongiiphila TaxID=419481 RepID=A0A1G5AQH7_9BACT|nr:hypothetical protein [Desulfoluna spongiiphila]SCX80092.1 hypothetical protein SAMN05216233_101376 [Desulfoluna spongiiphila]VVS91937.1 hypothetical protein DBB_15050 [Desulfoluna spongiiphila]
MKTMKKAYLHVVFAAVVAAFVMAAAPAQAGIFDFTQGRVAVPGTELHELGTEALDRGLGGISYFTNGEGRVVEVRAKEMANGDLRVAVRRVHIPKNYVADTHDQTLEAERTWQSLADLSEQQPWVGGYAVLPHNEGVKAYKFGVMVETEFNRNHQRDN